MIRKNVLITKGSHPFALSLAESLLRLGHRVTLLDTFLEEKSSMAHLQNYPAFRFLLHDISCALYVDVDEIYDFSHYAPEETSSMIASMKAVVFGSFHLLSLAKRSKAKCLFVQTLARSEKGVEQAKIFARAFCSEFQKEGVLAKVAQVSSEDASKIDAHLETRKKTKEGDLFFEEVLLRMMGMMESQDFLNKDTLILDQCRFSEEEVPVLG
ncbi:MAG: hypothetical protein AAGI90_05580 [Chlamydiota bacterium]